MFPPAVRRYGTFGGLFLLDIENSRRLASDLSDAGIALPCPPRSMNALPNC